MKVSLLKSIPLLVLLLVRCTEDPSSKPDDPNNPANAQLTLSVAELNYSDAGGSKSVVIRSNTNWTVCGTNDWCIVDHIDGSYDGEVTVTAQPNAGYDERSVNLTIKAGSVTRILTINQRKKDALTLTQARYEIKQIGGVIAVEVKHNIDFTVSIPQEFATWIIPMATKGLSTSSLQFDIAANPGYDPREGRIIIRNSDGTLTDTLYVTQAQLDKLRLTEQQRTVAPEGGTVAVAVTTNLDYDIIIPKEASWITLAPQTKGLRQEEYTFSVGAHSGYNSRSAEIVFKDRNSPAADTLHIIQLGQTVFENMTIALGTNQTISSLFSNTQLASIKKLTVTGSINVSDFTTVRTKMLNLEEIDLGATTCTLIPQTAFSKHPSLQKIILPSQTKTIEFSAFYECTSLKAIDIPQNVRKIPYAAFYRCYALETVTLPDEITSIGEAAFAECFSLKDFAMPTNCTVLGKSAFSSCGELKGPIHLSEGMVELPDNAFTGCANLSKIKLPNTLRSIGKSALSGIGADTLDIS